MFSTIRTNPKLATATVIVYGFMLGAAAISFVDIVHLAEKYGVPAPISYTAPMFIDGLAWLGKIGRSKDFAEKTRSAGLKLMAIGGALSLAANVMVGETIGLKVYGALVVAGFITAEWYSAKLEAAPAASKPATKAAARVTEAEKAARKRAGWDKMSPADKRAWTKNYRAKVAKRTEAAAPKSPGMPPVTAPSLEHVARVAA